jgi:hypothetical protein
MASAHYDPEKTPDPREWLALDEDERVRLVKNYHVAARVRLPNVKLHAMFHAIVENQIADGFGPTCRAMVRLGGEGLSRHEAIHAVSSVLAEFVFESQRMQRPSDDPENERRIGAGIEALSASEWRAKMGGSDG